jgi:hypothetical protein
LVFGNKSVSIWILRQRSEWHQLLSISFLDLTIALCKLVGQARSSVTGATKKNAETELELDAFKKQSEGLTSMQLGQPLKDAIDESTTVSTDLLALLERILKARSDKRFGVSKAVYLTLKHRDDVAALQRRVEKCQLSLAQGPTQETL